MALNNPLYPGYYPGDPIIKGPPGGGSVVGPTEFNLDVIGEEFDALEAMIPNIPEWTRKQIVEDIKFQLRATFYSESEAVSSQFLGAYETEEREDLPGAIGIVFSLNPEDWRDPKKQLKKTVTAWGKAIFDYDDLDARVKRKLWNDLLTKDPDPSAWTGVEATQESVRHAARTIAGGVTQNPLKLTGIDPALGGAEIKAVDSILEFQQNFRSAFAREGKYDDMLENALTLMGKDVGLQLSSVTDEAVRKMGTSFVARVEFAGVAGNVDKAVGKVNSALTRTLMETDRSLKEGLTPLEELLGKMDQNGNRVGGALKELEENVTSARGKIAELRTPMANGGKLTPQDLYNLGGGLGSFDDRLKEIQNLLAQGPGTSVISQKLFLNKLSTLRNLTPGHRAIKAGDSFTPSIRGQYLRSFEPLLIGRRGEGSELQRYFGRNGRGSIPKMRAILARQYVDKERELYREVFKNMADDKGGFSRTYVWARIRNTLVGYTPAYYVENFLKRVSYFGLKTDDDLVNAVPKFFVFRASNEIIKSLGIFQNKFKLGFRGGTGNIISEVFQGGAHFAAVGDLSKLDPAALYALFQLTDDTAIIAMLRQLNIGKPEEFLIKFKAFKAWLETHKNRAISDLKGDAQGLKNLLVRLAKYDANPDLNKLGITTKYIGLLQRTGQFLNKVQTTLMNNVVGKVISKILSIKTMIAETLSAALSIIIPAIAPLERVVATLIRIVLDATEKFVKNALKAVFKADMESFVILLEESAQVVLQLGKVIMIILLGGVIMITLIMMTVLTSIPPNNPGKAVGDGGDLYSTDPALAISPGTPFPGGPVVPQPPIENPTSCPLTGSVSMSCGSYPTCHGTNSYLTVTGCINIPAYVGNPVGVKRPLDPNYGGSCSGSCGGNNTPPCASPNYGYAADFLSSNKNVYAPSTVGGGAWQVTRVGTSGSVGQFVVLEAGAYKILLLHLTLNSAIVEGMMVAPGTHLGVFYPGLTTRLHVHVEMTINSVSVKPENYLCH